MQRLVIILMIMKMGILFIVNISLLFPIIRPLSKKFKNGLTRRMVIVIIMVIFFVMMFVVVVEMGIFFGAKIEIVLADEFRRQAVANFPSSSFLGIEQYRIDRINETPL